MIDQERAIVVANQLYGNFLSRLHEDGWSRKDIEEHWDRKDVRPALFDFLVQDAPHSFELREEALRFTIERMEGVFKRQRQHLRTYLRTNTPSEENLSINKENLALCNEAINLEKLIGRAQLTLKEMSEIMSRPKPSQAPKP